jgi:hypothetical protein
MRCKAAVKNPRGRNHQGTSELGGKIIIKWIQKIWIDDMYWIQRFRIGTNAGLLWTRKWRSGFYKERGISRISACLLDSSYWACSIVLVDIRILISQIWTKTAPKPLSLIHRVHCAGLSDVHGTSQYLVPCGGIFLGKWRNAFAGSCRR